MSDSVGVSIEPAGDCAADDVDVQFLRCVLQELAEGHVAAVRRAAADVAADDPRLAGDLGCILVAAANEARREAAARQTAHGAPPCGGAFEGAAADG